jgi:hypothetical protein
MSLFMCISSIKTDRVTHFVAASNARKTDVRHTIYGIVQMFVSVCCRYTPRSFMDGYFRDVCNRNDIYVTERTNAQSHSD